MQPLPPVVPGQLVRARAHLWTVEHVTHDPPWTALDLAGAEAVVAGRLLTLVAPHDEVRAIDRPARIRATSPRGASTVLGALIADAVPWPTPAVARDARIDLHAHQLSAALMLRTGRTRRVLLADGVGTGKTIQAGIAIAQTLADTPGARVLVALPASLKAQWRAELESRFAIHPRLVESVTPEAVGLGSASPWTESGVTLASFDFLKRVDVLGGLDTAWWHLLVVDEAHHAAGHSDRADALRAIAERSLQVLLVTATPHDGDAQRFARLCRLGQHGPDDRLAVLARDPRGPASNRRRTHARTARPSTDDARSAVLLERYLDAMARAAGPARRGAHALVASVLRKRAASSPAALAHTAWRRRALIAETPTVRQALLDFALTSDAAERGDEDAEDEVLSLRLADDPRRERAWLGAITESARRAMCSCGKLAALRRLLRRLAQPAIVFTGYRDTLAWLHAALRHGFACEVLHGLQGPAERQRALDAFTRGRARMLLATDAAAEGLNLHTSCRAVVLFDLPWTPTRIEQRIGRVDRLGQPRRVHAWLLDDGSGPAATFSARLDERRAAASTWTDDLARDFNPAGGLPHDGGRDAARERTACGHLARARAWHTAVARVGTAAPTRSAAALHSGPPRVARLQSRRLAALGLTDDQAVVVVAVTSSAEGEQVLERSIVPVRVTLRERGAASCSLPDAPRVNTAALSVAASRAAQAQIEARRCDLQTAWESAQRARDRAAAGVARVLRASITAHFAQPGLFDAEAPDGRPYLLPPPARSRSAQVVSLVTAPLMLLPRGWR